MATRWNLYGTARQIVPTTRGTWTSTASTVAIDMGGDKANLGGSAAGLYGPTIAGSAGDSSLAYKCVGPRLAAQTISGTVDYRSGVQVNTSLDADFHFRIHIYVMQPDGSVRGTLLSTVNDAHPGDEWSLTAISRTIAQQTLSSVACSAGDQVVVEVGLVRGASGTPRSLFMYVGGTGTDQSVGSNGITTAPWVEFSATLTLDASRAIVTQEALEVLLVPASSLISARVSQVALEVLVTASVAPATTARSQAVVVG
jgi:hypothetical protein